jgi:hypothetical protein
VESRLVTPARGSAKPLEYAVFHVDASTWIGLHEEKYPPDVFPSLWKALSAHAGLGRIKSPHEVMREVGEDQGVGAWLRMQQPTIVPRASPAVQRLVGEVQGAFPGLTKGKAASGDPWVVAFAQSGGPTHVVVTEEGSGGPTKPRIPDVCIARGVAYIGTLEMLRKLKISL